MARLEKGNFEILKKKSKEFALLEIKVEFSGRVVKINVESKS